MRGCTLPLVRLSPDRPLGLAPATPRDYRELARARLPRQLFDYIDGGAYEEATMRANVDDLERLLLRQVVLKDVSRREQATEVPGQSLSMPVILAPVGLCGMFARRAEAQAARAAAAAGDPVRRVDRLDLRHRGGRGGEPGAAVVPAVRDARPRLRRGADGAGRRRSAHRCSC